jgi:hypothetical protein
MSSSAAFVSPTCASEISASDFSSSAAVETLALAGRASALSTRARSTTPSLRAHARISFSTASSSRGGRSARSRSPSPGFATRIAALAAAA